MPGRSRAVPAVAAAFAFVLGGEAVARGSTADRDVHGDAEMSCEMARHTHEARCTLQAALSRLPPRTDPVEALERRLRPLRGESSAALEEVRAMVDVALHEPGCPEGDVASDRWTTRPGS